MGRTPPPNEHAPPIEAVLPGSRGPISQLIVGLEACSSDEDEQVEDMPEGCLSDPLIPQSLLR